jgi:NAD(P)-dependent dehydrogenase (short-subunit alcohol dehydrogenase family)
MDTIYKELPSGHGVEMKVWHVDMSSFASVNHFADKCASLDRIDGVALNAGALGRKGYVKTRDGHEEL